MRWFDLVTMKLGMLFGRRKAGAQLDDELLFHLERQIAENIAAGMSVDEARYAAMRTFGNPVVVREQARSTWSWTWLESMWNDVRYSARTLVRTPGFAVIAILVMALGIGANVALFTVVRSVVLKPLPYRDPGQLVTIYEADYGGNHPQWSPYLPVDAGSMKDWEQATRGMVEMTFLSPWQGYNLSAEGGKMPEMINAAWCSANFFPTLGVQPILGRTFSADDDRPGATATVVLSYPFWKRRYGGDANIVGKTIWLDARPFAVIGVLPESFVYLSKMTGDPLQVWTALNHEAPPSLLKTYEDHEFMVSARLLHGTTLPGAGGATQGSADADRGGASQTVGSQFHFRLDHARRRCVWLQDPAVRAAWRDRMRAADRLHERGQPAGGAHRGARPRTGYSQRAGRRPAAAGPGADYRKPASLSGRRGAGPSAGVGALCSGWCMRGRTCIGSNPFTSTAWCWRSPWAPSPCARCLPDLSPR